MAAIDIPTSALVIKELTGPDLRTVTLRERALPYKPMSFSGKHRINESGYAGSPQKSQQALGAEEDDSDWKGAWKTRFIGDSAEPGTAMAQVEGSRPTASTAGAGEVIALGTSTITSAAELAELFDDIRRKGTVCRVSFLHLVRVGRLAKFGQDWDTAHDVNWTMSWKWIGRDESAAAPTPSAAGLTGLSSELQASYVDLHDATDFDTLPELDPSVADLIDSRVGNIERGVMTIADAVENRVAGITDATQSMRAALALATFVRDEAETLIQEIDAITAPAILLVQDPEDLTSVTAGVAIAAACAQRAAVRAARALKHKAARQRFNGMRQLDANAIGVVMLAANQDLRDISQIYYGTPEGCDRIRAYNGLTTYSPPLGTVVVVPVQDTPG